MRTAVLFLCLLASMPVRSSAVEAGQVMYVGGTVAALNAGISGKLDTSSPTVLNFDSSKGKLAIPFESIDSYEYSQQVAHHLGVLPAIAVGLVKKRQHRHFFRIVWHDENKTQQVATFEVSKEMPRTLLAILQARAPQGCKPWPTAKCGVQPS